MTAHDFKKLRSMKKEETMHEESCKCGACPPEKDMKKEEVDLQEEHKEMKVHSSDGKHIGTITHGKYQSVAYAHPNSKFGGSKEPRDDEDSMLLKGPQDNQKGIDFIKAHHKSVNEEVEQMDEDKLALRGLYAPGAPMNDKRGGTGAYSYGVKPRQKTIDKRSQELKDVIKDTLGKHGPKGKLPEEVEQIEEMFPGTPEYEKKYGKAPQDMKPGEKKKTTKGEMEKTGKGVVHRRKFSEMVESYTEGGVKGLFKTLAEEPTSAEFDAQLDDAKKRAAGTKKQPEVSKPAVQAVQNEEIELTLEDFTVQELEQYMQTEDYDQLDELSKVTLGAYIKKSKGSAIGSSQVMGMGSGVTGQKSQNKAEKTVQKRAAGINRAVDRLTNEEVELTLEDFTPEELEEFMQTEEYEQLDELSKATLGSYASKRLPSVLGGEYKRGKGDQAASRYSWQFNPFDAKAHKEKEGLKRAVGRLAKEDVESFEEQTHTTVEFIDYNDVNGVKYAEIDLKERSMTASEKDKKEEIVKSMKKGLSGFKERYGDRAKEVMYATATKQAMKD